MRGTFKRIVAALVGVVMIATPGRAWASGLCSTFYQTASHATGGDYIAGILMYQTNGSVTRNESSTSTSTSVTNTDGVTTGVISAGSSTSSTVTVTSTGTSTTTSEPIGFYSMNDGTVWEVNCLSSQGHQL